MASWDRWARDSECAVVFVAHPPKSESLYSGSTDWLGAARTVWSLDHERENNKDQDSQAKLALTCEKANYGLPPQRVWLADRQSRRGVTGANAGVGATRG